MRLHQHTPPVCSGSFPGNFPGSFSRRPARRLLRSLANALLLSAGLSVGSLTYAASTSAIPFYADLQYTLGGVRHSDISFNPGYGTLAVGAWIRPGIGIEGFIDQGSSSSREGNFELELVEASGVNLRFQ